MQIDWPTLAVVAIAAGAAAVTVVLLVAFGVRRSAFTFAFALVGLSASAGRRVGDDGITPNSPRRRHGRRRAARVLAAGLIVCYCLHLLID